MGWTREKCVISGCGGGTVTSHESRTIDSNLEGNASESPAYYEWSERREGSDKADLLGQSGFERQSDGTFKAHDVIVCLDFATWLPQLGSSALSLRLPTECSFTQSRIDKTTYTVRFVYTQGAVTFPTSTTASMVLAYQKFEAGRLVSTVQRTLSGVKVSPPSDSGEPAGGTTCDPKLPKGSC